MEFKNEGRVFPSVNLYGDQGSFANKAEGSKCYDVRANCNESIEEIRLQEIVRGNTLDVY